MLEFWREDEKTSSSFFLSSCSKVYIEEKKLSIYEFEKIFENKYKRGEPVYIEIDGDFESTGKTYMRGFFKVIFKEGDLSIKIISPPFFVREFKNNYLKNLFFYYFVPDSLVKNVIGIKEKGDFYVLDFKSARAFFHKKNAGIYLLYFEDGFIKFNNFHDNLPALIEISYLDEHILLKIKGIYLKFK